jgi:hypothetical protein
LLPEAIAAINAAERGIAGARAALVKDAAVRVGVVSLALLGRTLLVWKQQQRSGGKSR